MDRAIEGWENRFKRERNQASIDNFCFKTLPKLTKTSPSHHFEWREQSNTFQSTSMWNTDSFIAPVMKNKSNEIIHRDISKFGHTTNVLIHSYLDKNRGKPFTREEIRTALENHKQALESNGMEEQYLTRIRVGKSSVNYWIDTLVENGAISKKNSNPVLFWLAR